MPSRFLSPAYEVMLSAASPGINFLRSVAGYQDPIGTPAMQDRMLELEAQKGPSGSIGYEDYGLPVSSEGGRFTGGLPSLLLSNPIDFGLAGSVGRYGYSPEGRTGLKYDFTPDEETGSTGNAILDFINKGGIKNYISESKGIPFALPDLSLGAPTFNFNRNKTTQPNFINAPQDYYQPIGIRTVAPQQSFQDFYGSVYEPYDPEKDDYRVKKIQGPEKKGIAKLMEVLGNIPTPLNLLRKAFEGVGPGFIGPKGSRAYGDESLFSTFGRSRTGAEFFQNMRDRKARQEAAARGAAKQADQTRIDAFRAFRDSQPSGGGESGGIGSSYGGAASPGSKGPGGSDEWGSF